MILVDTSVWIDHFRRGDGLLIELLQRADVITHPFVIGEIACGDLRNRSSTLELLQDLPVAVVADEPEVLAFIDSRVLYGRGVGYVDVHLLASVALTGRTKLWTRDKKLRVVAKAMGCAFADPMAH